MTRGAPVEGARRALRASPWPSPALIDAYGAGEPSSGPPWRSLRLRDDPSAARPGRRCRPALHRLDAASRRGVNRERWGLLGTGKLGRVRTEHRDCLAVEPGTVERVGLPVGSAARGSGGGRTARPQLGRRREPQGSTSPPPRASDRGRPLGRPTTARLPPGGDDRDGLPGIACRGRAARASHRRVGRPRSRCRARRGKRGSRTGSGSTRLGLDLAADDATSREWVRRDRGASVPTSAARDRRPSPSRRAGPERPRRRGARRLGSAAGPSTAAGRVSPRQPATVALIPDDGHVAARSTRDGEDAPGGRSGAALAGRWATTRAGRGQAAERPLTGSGGPGDATSRRGSAARMGRAWYTAGVARAF